jgi:ABC-type uncharacterized transport system permease subunit
MIIIQFICRAILLGVPLLYGSVGEIITEKSGHLNLGIPGIMYVGAISGVVGSFLYENSCGNDIANMVPFLAVLIPLLCAIAGATIMGLAFGLLMYKYKSLQICIIAHICANLPDFIYSKERFASSDLKIGLVGHAAAFHKINSVRLR